MLIDSKGQPYCPMSGHSEYGCDSEEVHMALLFADIGVSRVPGPTDRELLEEVRNDFELLRDEFHGRIP